MIGETLECPSLGAGTFGLPPLWEGELTSPDRATTVVVSALHAKNNVHDALHFTEALRVQVIGHFNVFVGRPIDLKGETHRSAPSG